MLLTPPVPGNQRVGVWSQKQLTYEEWTVKLDFRSNGAERPGGSLNLWYTQSTGMGTNTVYSSKPFDGLGIVIESRDAGVTPPPPFRPSPPKFLTPRMSVVSATTRLPAGSPAPVA